MTDLLVILIFLSAHVEKPYLETRADVLELNHVYDSKACHQFSQIIAWNWDEGQKHVDWWCLAQKKGTSYRLNGDYADLHIEQQWYRVSYGEFKETWSQWDPERLDLQCWPVECRRELPERVP